MKILVLDLVDFGGDVCALKNVKVVLPEELREKHQFDVEKIYINDLDDLRLDQADKIIVSGSARSAYEDFHWKERLKLIVDKILASGKPTLAICFGAQYLAQYLGGEVIRNPNGTEFGAVQIKLTDEGKTHPYLEGLDEDGHVFASHNDRVEILPEGAILLAGNDNSPVQAYSYKNIFATQFHPDFHPDVLVNLLKVREQKYRDLGFIKSDEHLAEVLSKMHLGAAGQVVMSRFLDEQ